MTQLNVHLISDQGIDALLAVSRESTARFKDVEVRENLWPVTNTDERLQQILSLIEGKSLVLYSIRGHEIRDTLKKFCQKNKVPCIPILSRVIRELSAYLKQEPTDTSKEEYHIFNEDYFARIDAMNYMLSHDDGQNTWDLDEADIVLVGPSRTSKSPTCVYLSHRGYKAANVPFVRDISLPEILTKLDKVLVIGLSINADRLVQIRKHRLPTTQSYDNSVYADRNLIINELRAAKKIYLQNKWPIIDVTHRSVEEIAAAIMKEYQIKKIQDL